MSNEGTWWHVCGGNVIELDVVVEGVIIGFRVAGSAGVSSGIVSRCALLVSDFAKFAFDC